MEGQRSFDETQPTSGGRTTRERALYQRTAPTIRKKGHEKLRQGVHVALAQEVFTLNGSRRRGQKLEIETKETRSCTSIWFSTSRVSWFVLT
jgi:hypothetical protein